MYSKKHKNFYKFEQNNQLAKNVNEIQIQEHQKMKELEKLEKQAQNDARMRDVNFWFS